MAVRQYIGARYVPLLYTNSLGTAEWEAGVIYEPLTIVTYNSNSYTSRKMVPASVGDPSANPDYWVATGQFNAAVAALSNRMDAVEPRVDTLEKKTGWYTPEMYGATGDGVTDDSAAIQAMFADVPERALIVFTAPMYVCNAQININKRFLRITGLAQTEYSPIIDTDITSGALFYVTASGVTFTGLQLQGPVRGTTTAAAIEFDSTTQGGNTDCQVYDVFIYRFEYGIRSNGRNCHIRNCSFSAPRYGVTFLNTPVTAELRGHYVGGCLFHGVPVAISNNINNALAVRNITIENNRCDGESASLYNGYGGNINILNNVVYIVPTTGGSGVVILMNGSTGITETEYNVIAGNELHIGGKQFAGIGITGDCPVIVKDNYIEDTARRGIYHSGAANAIIANNVINKTGTSWAIECDALTTGAIANNIIRNTNGVAPGGTTETGTITAA